MDEQHGRQGRSGGEDPRVLFEQLFESAPVAFQILRPGGACLLVNRAFRELFAAGQPVGDCDTLRPELFEGRDFLDLFRRAAGGETVRLAPHWYDPRELRHVRLREGKRTAVEITLFPLRDASAEAGHVAVCFKDVTADRARELERDRAEESRYLMEEAQSIAHVGSWVAGVDMGDRLVWSREIYRIFGLPEDTPTRVETFFSAVHPEDRERVQAASAAARERDEPYDVQHRIVRGDGAVRWVHQKAVVIRDPEGAAVRLLGVCQDITERRHLEEQFRQAQKMEAVGRLAGGIAHDFNNVLMIILSYASLALRRVGPRDPLRADLDEITRAAERAADLTRQLLAFSRKQVLQPRVLDLSRVAAEMQNMLERFLGEDVELAIVAAQPTGRVRADRSQIEQIIMNLVVNARDAMPQGGKLTIETADVDVNARAAAEHGMTPGAYVKLSVTDTGVGMDASTSAQIFEPFFTTKEQGKGTGLGLSTVYGIVRQSGGHVAVWSEVGRGTTLSVYLPRTDSPASEAQPGAAAGARAAGGTETILLVEDDAQVRAVMEEVLRGCGYEILVAKDPREAIVMAETYARPIHLLLTDVVMPEMNGTVLAGCLAAKRPEMRILYVSGYSGDTIVQRSLVERGAAFVAKPVTPETLVRTVRAVLDRAS